VTTADIASLPSIGSRIATEFGAKPAQVTAIALLDEGATVPCIALQSR